ncbi:hypothetical protein MKX01_035928 [Papaver californicum]|nr:hypothetical protein MKX01_035928 [Papaver californicum]
MIKTKQSKDFILFRLQLPTGKMKQICALLLLLLGILFPLILAVQDSESMFMKDSREKSAVFLSPNFVLGAGSVGNKVYYNIDFPRGHIAIKEFKAEVVDDSGIPVPLHETYLHHWIILRYYGSKDRKSPEGNNLNKTHPKENIILRNHETRKTATYVPDPYGIEVGNPADTPKGYDERWLVNIHAIDTRCVVDRLGCTECKCDLYNVTTDEYGRQLPQGYTGGLKCCDDETQCRLRQGCRSIKKSFYLRYTVKWVDWRDSIVPAKIYIFDVTDTWIKGRNSATACKVEYEVERFGSPGVNRDLKCDGHLICTSIPVYGNGKEAGNEAGYIVGMSTCYPQPGTVKISDGETLVSESNYSSIRPHAGVMGLFYILVADKLAPKPSSMPVHA